MKREGRIVWERRVEALLRSRQSAVRFADEIGVSVHTLRYWKRMLDLESRELEGRGRVPTSEAPTTFLEVSAAMVEPASQAMEIVFDDGTTVRVPPGFDEASLRRVLSILGRAR